MSCKTVFSVTLKHNNGRINSSGYDAPTKVFLCVDGAFTYRLGESVTENETRVYILL